MKVQKVSDGNLTASLIIIVPTPKSMKRKEKKLQTHNFWKNSEFKVVSTPELKQLIHLQKINQFW